MQYSLNILTEKLYNVPAFLVIHCDYLNAIWHLCIFFWKILLDY